MAEYKLSYTAAQIDARLGKVTKISEDVGNLQENVQVISNDVQVKAEIVTLSSEEYETLEANEATNANTLYMLTDSDEEEYALQSDLETYQTTVNDALALKADKIEIPTVPTNISAFTNDAGYLTEHQSLADYAKTADLGALATKDTVFKSDLASDVQTSLNKADTAIQSVAGLATETYVNNAISAIPTPDVSGQINTHNTATNSHNDIRLLVEGLTTRLNTLANSDDTTLDQMAEVVAYIKSNRSLIEEVTTNKVNVADIIDNLTTNVSNKPLSAAQGVALKALIDAISVPTKTSELTNDSGYLTSYTETDPTVPAWAKAASKPTYTASEVGADAGGTAANAVSSHNTASSAHSDIRAAIPTKVSQLTNDAGYLKTVPDEYVTETELNAKGYLTEHQDLSDYAKTADLGFLATKSTVSKTDLDSTVQASLNKADSALQSYTESDPTVPSHVKNIKTSDITNWNNKSTFDGNYNSLTNKPNIPAAANNGTLTIQKNGTTVTTFGANQSTNATANITVPTKTSDITNDSGFITSSAIPSSLKNPAALTFGSKTYDGSAAKEITAADLGLSGAMKFLGTSTTAISDGSTTKTITVNGSSVTATAGNVVLYDSKEFVWDGSKWEELGHEGSFKVKQAAVVSPSASGSTTAFIDTISQDANGNITATKKNITDATTSAKGIVQLINSTSSTSTTTAATPSSVKSAYDLANTAKTNAATAQARADSAYSLAEGKVDSLSDLGVTATAAELNYVDGVTSNIQTQLNGKLGDYTIEIYNGTSGNPKPVRFASFNYSTCGSENGIAAKISLVSGHGNGTSYAFLEDAIIRVNHLGDVSVDNFKYYGADAGSYDEANRQYGDIFWLHDTTNKIVDFYVLMGQYARVYQTPWKRLTYSTGGTVTQHTSCTVYSSGDKVWGNNSEIALMSDLNTFDTRLTALEDSIVTVYSGSVAPLGSVGEDGDIYLYTGA